MAVFMIKSNRGDHAVYVSEKDAERVTNYARFYTEKRVKDYKGRDLRDDNGYPLEEVDYSGPVGAWHIIWKKGKISAVTTNVFIGPRFGTKRERRTKQVKLHEFIIGDIPNCKGIRFRDENPLNNRRENLVIYQVYETEVFNYETKSGKRTNICVGCVDVKTCRRVPTRKRILPLAAGSGGSA